MQINTNVINNFKSMLLGIGFSRAVSDWLTALFLMLAIILLAWLAKRIARRFIFDTLNQLISKKHGNWERAITKRHLPSRFANLAAALVLYYSIRLTFVTMPQLSSFLQAIVGIYAIITILFSLDSVLDTLYDIYNELPIAKGRPIKGYIQIIKIFLYFISIILILSIILNKDVKYLLTGLGAIAAVLLLVFKDTILGFVASIQLSANDMVQIGDWISMPSKNADGSVEEISLNTVKIRNWDNTISTVPTYQLVSESFSNWRGMQELGGRRIKRSIFIDMTSVRFADNSMIEKFKTINLISSYIDEKLAEIEASNISQKLDKDDLLNSRHITNLGTFRKYLELYLENNSNLRKDMTMLVRHLQPTEKGLPIEIYTFSNNTEWKAYEAIQADIFDHIIAILPEFGLRVFQNPTGTDFRQTFSTTKGD